VQAGNDSCRVEGWATSHNVLNHYLMLRLAAVRIDFIPPSFGGPQICELLQISVTRLAELCDSI